ncbi:TetR/AcrR family transcriptional regulator [Novosphingobium sp.]|jgi:TetR/AcrR family transcriptional repressor of nem operon|uniref:TetR/AcrR family transcriptional regulator n=1 Tax=Novosphingobium sp. TaxID=1874826 RepID=UPI0031D3A03E
MKVTKAQATENREAILRAAAEQIRLRGFDQMSVAEVARAASLSHGALYSHFKSKEVLQAEATRHSFDDTISTFTGLSPDAFVQTYFSVDHRNHPELGCPNAALVSEIWRQPPATQQAFRAGIERFVELVSETLTGSDGQENRDRAVLLFAAMVGGMALSRAVSQVDQAFADDILRAVSSQMAGLIDPAG